MNLYKNDLPSDVAISGSVAVDTETMGLVTKRDRLCLVQLCTSDDKVYMVQIQQGKQDEAKNLKKLLMDKSVLKIFHYARFDVAILNYTFGISVSPIYCTKIASKLVRTYTDKHGLRDLCKELLDLEISKNEQTSDWGREELSQEQLKYAAGDVLYLHKIKSKLDEMLQREWKMDLAKECFDTIKLMVDLDLAGAYPRELFSH